jgi:hypothetical protein
MSEVSSQLRLVSATLLARQYHARCGKAWMTYPYVLLEGSPLAQVRAGYKASKPKIFCTDILLKNVCATPMTAFSMARRVLGKLGTFSGTLCRTLR